MIVTAFEAMGNHSRSTDIGSAYPSVCKSPQAGHCLCCVTRTGTVCVSQVVAHQKITFEHVTSMRFNHTLSTFCATIALQMPVTLEVQRKHISNMMLDQN